MPPGANSSGGPCRTASSAADTASLHSGSAGSAPLRDKAPMEQASEAGKLLAERAAAAGVTTAVFDRGGYQYHGRVKAFAEVVREGGVTV